MAVIGRFSKQPREVMDIDISLVQFFAARGDNLESYQIIMPMGLTLERNVVLNNVIKLLVSGGMVTPPNTPYKIEILVTTDTGVVAEDEVQIDVIEV